jgi:hypothetical protein
MNRLDRAEKIAGYAKEFEQALVKAGASTQFADLLLDTQN